MPYTPEPLERDDGGRRTKAPRRWIVGLAVAGLACAVGPPEAQPLATPASSEPRSEPPTAAGSSAPSPAPEQALADSPALDAAPDEALEPAPEPPVALPERQRAHIEEWFQQVGEPRPDESFGSLMVRAARHKLGAPYAKTSKATGPETLSIDVDALDCVTLIETSTAIARCSWQHRPDVSCFADEVRQTRYRDGRIEGYASRLHYFEDWLADNERRHRLRSLADELGAKPTTITFHFMTKHPRLYPVLRDPAVKDTLREIEQRLSETPWPVVPLGHIDDVQHLLRDGDVLAFVDDTPGLGVSHTGMVSLDDQGRPRMLHATDLTGRVSLTRCEVATCARRKQQYGHKGLIVTRPLPPPVEGSDAPAG